MDNATVMTRVQEAGDALMSGKIDAAGQENFRRMAKTFLLQSLDQHWKEHLLNLDHLRQGINLRAFGQRDPLNEYKAEAFMMFEHMLNNLRENVTQTLALVEVNISPEVLEALQKQQEELEARRRLQERHNDPSLMGLGIAPDQSQRDNVAPFRKAQFDQNDPTTWGNTQRNAPCPCGSGKKYKHCHGAAT